MQRPFLLSLFTGLGFVMFGLPAILGLIAVVIFFFYPLRKKSKRDADVRRDRSEKTRRGSLNKYTL